MANNNLYGYTPKNEKPLKKRGQAFSGAEKSNRIGQMTKDGTYANFGNRLDRVNPYEFRKGMDYELTAMGISRLQESTPEEREKTTEIVLKNLETKHPAYYSALLQFETGMNHGKPIGENTFNAYLKTYSLGHGDGMMSVDKEFKDDKMVELKESIKREIRSILKEQDEEDFDSDTGKADKAATQGAKKTKLKSNNRFDLEKEAIKDLLYRGKKGKESEYTEDDPAPKSILDIKNQMLELYKSKFKGIEGGADKYNEELKKANQKFQKDLEKHVEKFGEKGKGNAVTVKDVYGDSLPATIKLLGARLKTIEKEEEAEVINKTNERRKIAETDMTREQHIKLLEIVRDNGISLKEGAMGVKVYYEIAKAAYLEGVANAHRL